MPETLEKQAEEKKQGILEWLAEDDSPEIGIATKEPLPEYIEGIKSEYKRITWPSKEQVQSEFVTVLVIVAIITGLVYFIDLGLEQAINFIK